jgi:hypothetical protein
MSRLYTPLNQAVYGCVLSVKDRVTRGTSSPAGERNNSLAHLFPSTDTKYNRPPLSDRAQDFAKVSRSMFDWSLQTANEILGISNIALILGATLVLAGTVGAIRASAVRDRYADERISNNETRTALANESAAKANERAAELTKQAAALEVDLERERTERLKLEAEIAPRRLTRAQHEAMATALSPFAGGTVIITSHSHDAESAVLAKQIIAALQAARLHTIDGAGTLMQMGRFAMGVQVAGPNRALAAAIKQFLEQTAHLAVAAESPPQLVPDPVGIVNGITHSTPIDVSILVGVKPPTR